MSEYLLIKFHLENLVEIDDTGIRPVRKPREGWTEAFKKAAEPEHHALIEMPDSEWDKWEWQW
jgi:hypothetical protein